MHRPHHTRTAAARANELRRSMTISEATLWIGIRNQKAGARFRRQVPIGPWIVDFAAFDPMLVIEVDGPSHDWRDEQHRTSYLEARGFAVLRLSNKDIATDTNGAVSTVERWVRSLRSTGRPPD